jgi:hypothetical protein
VVVVEVNQSRDILSGFVESKLRHVKRNKHQSVHVRFNLERARLTHKVGDRRPELNIQREDSVWCSPENGRDGQDRMGSRKPADLKDVDDTNKARLFSGVSERVIANTEQFDLDATWLWLLVAEIAFYFRAFGFLRCFRALYRLDSFSISSRDTATTRFVKFLRRSIGVSPGTWTFIGASFCRAGVAALLSQHVCGTSLPVRTV